MGRLGPLCLQVGETYRQLDDQDSCLSKASTKMQLLVGERTWKRSDEDDLIELVTKKFQGLGFR